MLCQGMPCGSRIVTMPVARSPGWSCRTWKSPVTLRTLRPRSVRACGCARRVIKRTSAPARRTGRRNSLRRRLPRRPRYAGLARCLPAGCLADQRDLVFDGAPPAADQAGADVAEQSGHGRVSGVGQGGEAADSFLAGAVRQLSQQLGAQSPALPVIDDGDRDILSRLRVVGIADIAGDAHAAAASPAPTARERLMVVVVDIGEVGATPPPTVLSSRPGTASAAMRR